MCVSTFRRPNCKLFSHYGRRLVDIGDIISSMNVSPLPQSQYESKIVIGDAEIPCAVLDDGRRLLTQQGFLKAIGRARSAKGGQGSSVDGVIPFLAAKNLSGLVDDDLKNLLKPVQFRTMGGRPAYGFSAEALPEVCNLYLKARDLHILHKWQDPIAVKCDMLVRGLAVVGIVALVDEATGYQRDRANDALSEILRTFISPRLRAWVKTFPDDFYKELFRVYGLTYSEFTTKRPRFIGRLTRDFIYSRLPTGVLEELEARNPVVPGRGRKVHHHRLLSEDIGHPVLQRHVWGFITLAKVCPVGGRTILKKMVNQAFPKPPTPSQLISMNQLPGLEDMVDD